MPFSRLQHHRDALGHVVGHEGRQADAEVDVGAVGELARPRGRPSRHGSAPCQVSRLSRRRCGVSIALLDVGADHHDALHVDAGQVHLVGVELARLDELLDLRDA